VLSQLADNVEARGGHVFWAADAAEANDYVTSVAKRTGTKLAVKSKSMASEEIHLNAALEAQGVEVVETDLGEWIIQLAGETPSHIIAPALHKNRRDVAELFSRIAGGDVSDVPAELCAFARERLREKFVRADLGITGVNFGVAETGTVITVTNEGNGRMVSSLPRTHIAIMGMERVVESWTQLDVLLALLTRAATGQPISVYVTAVTGPRRAPEVDGPDEFHLVILDNGRSKILGTEFQEVLHCIRCGACLNVCPVYRQIGGHAYGSVYSGPIGAVLTPLLVGTPEAKELSGASSLCSACWQACPVKIPLQDMLLHLRTQKAPDARAAERAAWKAWAAAWSSPTAYRASTRLAATAARMLPDGLGPKSWQDGRTRPKPPKGASFRQRFERGDI
jgi:L-lactate dehydrogenase complex protein LldF